MRMLNFAKRNFKELVRDPLSFIFAILLPLFLLFIFQQFNIPAESYKLENFTPGIILFGFSFLGLSLVMMTWSLCLYASCAINGRFPLSRFPPAPHIVQHFPRFRSTSFIVESTLANASGVCA